MPLKIRKLPNKELYNVTNPTTGKVYAHGTTKVNAKKVVRIINSLEKK
jgi:hypothetical protein